MIFCTVGLPGRFAEWCETAIARIAEAAGARVTIKSWPAFEEMLGYQPLARILDELALSLILDAPDHIVLGARQPDERLRLALAETGAPFIIALEDPRNAVSDIVQKGNVDPVAAARVVANSCPFVMRYTTMPRGLRLIAQEVRLDAAGTLVAIAAHLGLPLSAASAWQIADDLAKAGAAPEAAPEERVHISDQRTAKIIDDAIGPYAEFFSGRPMRQFAWSRELFMVVGDARRPTEPIDVSGGSRYIIYGPYIHLPPGSWSARIVLGFSSETVGSIFLVDATCAQRQVGAVSFRVDHAGMHTAEINFTLPEPEGQGVEIRVMVMSEQAHGWLAFGQASMTPLSLSHPDATQLRSEAFEAVLEL